MLSSCRFIANDLTVHLHIGHSALTFCLAFSSALFFSRYSRDWNFIFLYVFVYSVVFVLNLSVSSIWCNGLKTLHLEHCLVSVIGLYPIPAVLWYSIP